MIGSAAILSCYRFVPLLTFLFKISNPIARKIGKIVAASSPTLRSPPAISERFPTIAGLTVATKIVYGMKTTGVTDLLECLCSFAQ